MLSFTALLSNVFFSSLFILIICQLLKSKWGVKQIRIEICFICALLILLRLCLPFEFNHFNIPVKSILPDVSLFLNQIIITYKERHFKIKYIFYLIWGIAAVILMIRTLWSYLSFGQNIKQLPDSNNFMLNDVLDKVIKKYNKKVDFKIVQTGKITMPMVFGLKKTYIIVPFLNLSEKEWYYILSHEAEHYYHGDLWIKVIFELLSNVYWWNPLVYLLKRQVAKTLEIHNDLKITGSMNDEDQIEYLECLLKIAKQHKQLKLDKMALSFGAGSMLVNRCHLIVEQDTPNVSRYLSLCFIIIPLCALFIISFFIVFEPYGISKDAEFVTVELNKDTAYLYHTEAGYEIYYLDEFFGFIGEIDETLRELSVYYGKETISE